MPNYQAGSALLLRALDRAVADEGLTFTDANEVFHDAIPGVLRAAIDLRRECQQEES